MYFVHDHGQGVVLHQVLAVIPAEEGFLVMQFHQFVFRLKESEENIHAIIIKLRSDIFGS